LNGAADRPTRKTFSDGADAKRWPLQNDLSSETAGSIFHANRMTKLSRIFWISAGVLFAAATVAIHYQVKYVMHHREAGSVQTMGHIMVGQPAPDFTLTDLSNHTVTLSAYRGHRVVLMDFWATGCGPCRMESGRTFRVEC
jgi:hypothetical protein